MDVRSDIYSYPLSLCQRRLWLLEQFRPRNSIYNLSTLIHLPWVDVNALQHSCDFVVGRHDVLRTTFEIIEDKPCQIVHPEMMIPIEVVNLDLPGDSEMNSATVAISEAAKRPFNLRSGPLMRTTLLRVSPKSHLFLVTMHHIISDAKSVELFLSEVRQRYEAFMAGVKPSLPMLPIQYSDYSVWQHQYLQGDKLQDDVSFWEKALADLPTVQLPTDFSRKLEPSFEGTQVELTLDQAAVLELAAIGQRQSATLFMTLLAVFYVLLARYSSQDDLVIGTPISGRSHMQLENLIGFFVNSLVLRCNLSDDPSFETLVTRVRATAIAAYAHQELPFEMLVEKLKPPRDFSRNPLFQILFQVQHANASVDQVNAGANSPYQLLQPHSSPFDLALNIWERSGTVGGTLLFATDLFRPETITRMARHFANLVSAAARRPSAPISELSILDSGEHQLMVHEWNETSTPEIPQRRLHEWVVMYAVENPEAIAIVAPDRSITYAELNTNSAQLAARLRQAGVREGNRVAVRIERSTDAIVSLVAIWKAGGVYVPIDPEYPVDRALFMLRDSDARIVLVSERTAGQLKTEPVRELLVENKWLPRLTEVTFGTPSDGTMPDSAYIIYTSGSTGRPKGVMLEHLGLANVLEAQRLLLPITSQSRILQFSSLSFDASIFEVGLAFGSGAALCIPDRESVMPDPVGFPEMLARMDVNVVVVPPPVLAAIDPGSCPTLKTVLFAGDSCSAEIAKAWLPGRRVFNLYGPTETTIWSTAAELKVESEKPPIGRPILNSRTYVLDSHLRPVPIGVQGELCLSGIGLARGYLNQAEFTAESFVSNPFDNSTHYGTLYKTGDLCRFRADAQLEYLGRLDRQVKVRGFRIELSEVEKILRSHPAVDEVCAVVRGKGTADACVIAYIILRSDASAEALLDLRAYVRCKLPPYAVPASILFIDAFPLTHNGKIDWEKLAREDVSVRSLQRKVATPRNETERAICSVWRQVLEVPQVGADESFFELGGHSLLAIRAQALLEQSLGRTVKIADLFQYPTPASLSSHLFKTNREVEVSSLTSAGKFAVPLVPGSSVSSWGNEV